MVLVLQCWKWTCEFMHDDVIKWKHFPHYWPFVRGIHQSHRSSLVLHNDLIYVSHFQYFHGQIDNQYMHVDHFIISILLWTRSRKMLTTIRSALEWFVLPLPAQHEWGRPSHSRLRPRRPAPRVLCREWQHKTRQCRLYEWSIFILPRKKSNTQR